jgi:hypothetical protein
MRRLEFIAGLGGTAVWSVVARAQQGAIAKCGRVGVSAGNSPSTP